MLEKIAEGEELTVSYVDFLNLSADRKKKLKERFHFECTCEHCSHQIKDDLMMAIAESKVRWMHIQKQCHKVQISFLP